MNLLDKSLENILTKIQITTTDSELPKFKHLVTVTNQAYLKIALNEFKNIKNQEDHHIVSNFDFLMKLYNKHLKEHQVMFLLFNIFETAIRSKATIELSRKFSSAGTDDWLHNPSQTPRRIVNPLAQAIIKIRQDGESERGLDSFEIFDYIMLGQLKAIYVDFWSDLSHLFDEKTKNGQTVSKIGKNKLKALLDEIRKARNDNAHHKPFHRTRKRRHQIIEDIELILIHIGFNLNDAINNIDPHHKIIILKYS